MNLDQYLKMQRDQYEQDAGNWSLENRDPVVGTYDLHNKWADYDLLLFRGINTQELVALEYGCGPGRNLIKFSDKFKRIDGVDIAQTNLDNAKINLETNTIFNSELFLCDGKSIPCSSDSYDVVFSVICLQHIACYDIRFSIFEDIKRVLKPGGYFCFQMGFGGKETQKFADYYDNVTDATRTNGGHDVSILHEEFLISDLITKLGFTDYTSVIAKTGPGDNHKNWIWVQVKK